MFKTSFCWMTQDLGEFKGTITELFDKCLNKDMGQFIHYFGHEFVDSLLDLSDEELHECYPNTECPLSYDERQELKQQLFAHVLNCQACTDVELQNEATQVLLEKAICGKNPDQKLALI